MVGAKSDKYNMKACIHTALYQGFRPGWSCNSVVDALGLLVPTVHCFITTVNQSCEGLTSSIIDRCANHQLPFQNEQNSLRNVSSTSLNQYHEDWKQFWKQTGVQLDKGVQSGWWIYRTYTYIYMRDNKDGLCLFTNDISNILLYIYEYIRLFLHFLN